MLSELAVEDLGVIEKLSLLLGPGMTAVTGETGAGKTLVVGAIDLLVGGRADPRLVRPGAAEARVEGRFLHRDDEVVVTRVIPREGRSRAYIDGRLATVAALAELGAELVDLHGQHAHQSLLSPSVQRRSLDRFGSVDLAPLHDARQRLAEIDRALDALGGDERARAREIDLLRYQVDELAAASLEDPGEDDRLEAEEDRLADAVAHREAAGQALEALTGEGGGQDRLAAALAAVAGRAPFAAAEGRLLAAQAELADVAAELRAAGEAIVEDPERLAAVRARRRLLHELTRKYGESLAEVIAYRDELSARLADLEAYEERARALDARRGEAVAAVDDAAAAVGRARRAAAPGLAEATQSHLAALAMPKARLGVSVADDDPGDDVAFTLAANPGAALLPLAKVASGGELARTMLALRLVLTAGPPVLVFDEVDAGVGGAAALAVGRSLAALGADHQVLVVTHLPQVAAFADAQVAVAKADDGSVTTTQVAVLDEAARVVELARMLSGTPDSEAAHEHAAELLGTAARERGR
ncbi:MAG: DNA repair protein RecN [Microthrixaceae bacterium]|nr:DNA repair protein RecN [Microthrixaceae bacterium]